MFPKFIGIGAQKAGTTWLHRNLVRHPEIYMPRKEVHYFDRKIRDRSNALTRIFGKSSADDQWRRRVKLWLTQELVKAPSLENFRRDFSFYMRSYDDRWYASVFEPDKGRMTGEITPAYSALKPEVIAHVHDLMPDAKLIFMMRNPIERVWSQAVMSLDKVERGSARSVPREQLLKKLERDSARVLSDYRRTLENWGEFYPPERVFVGFLEDVHFHPGELLGGIFSFLGVDPSFRPPAPEKKVHSRSVGEMPVDFASRLAESYSGEIGQLAERFGGYASFWEHCARRLAEDPPEGEGIVYPLYESYLWDEWRGETGGSGPVELKSGPLSSVQVVG